MGNVKVTGSRQLTAMLNKIGKEGGKVAEAALYQGGQKILAAAIPQTPRDTGALRNSGNVSLPSNGVVEVYFGGPAAPYAYIVHENPNARHPVGNYKYLENAVTSQRGVAFKMVHSAVRAMIQGAS